MGSFNPAPPDSRSLPFNESLGNEMEAEAQDGGVFLDLAFAKKEQVSELQ